MKMIQNKNNWHRSALQEVASKDEGNTPAEVVKHRTDSFIKMFYGRFVNGPPFNPEILASLMGARVEYKKPFLGEEAQLIPFADHLLIRCNPYRPRVRQNFSLFHELSHILLMDFQIHTSCKRASQREPGVDDEIEKLCDISAAELLMPPPWFEEDIQDKGVSIDTVLTLSRKYMASKEAVTIRMVQAISFPCAGVFFSWTHKPGDKKISEEKRKQYLFPEMALPSRKLRVDFSVSSSSFPHFIPRYKSVKKNTLVHQSFVDGKPRKGKDLLDLGKGEMPFYIETLPLLCKGKKGTYRVITLLK